MKPRRSHNPKKRIRSAPCSAEEKKQLAQLAEKVRYVGNPDHKRNPGDYGLEPPSRPRLGKSLCDTMGNLLHAQAQSMLQQGIARGCISAQEENGWPRIVWAVLDNSVLEARLDNAHQGTYHGYPLESDDPFAALVLERWNSQ